MKLQNRTKNWKTRTTLFTTKIVSLIKRKMRFRISDWARLETTYVPTGELSSKKTEET